MELDGDQLRDAALLHRHAIEKVGDLHGALVVRDEDELRAMLEGVQRAQEAVDVDLVEGVVGLVEDAERRRSVLEDGQPSTVRPIRVLSMHGNEDDFS